MFILVQQFFDVSWHQNVEGVSGIIPIELDSTIKIPRPVLGKFAFCFDAINLMINVFLSRKIYSKIVHNQCE